MSLEKKVKIGLLALAGNAACTSENYSIDLNGVTISEAVTDSEGIASFVEKNVPPGQTEEEVEVEVTAFDKPVENASVLYFDNVFSEGFFISSEGHAPQLYISLHNSDHTYSITPAPLQILHDSFQKEQSKPGAETFFSWAEANWDYTGCLNRDNMRTLMKPGAFLIKRLGIIETFGIAEDDFDEGVTYIEEKLPPGAVANMYVFISANYGFQTPTTTLAALDINFDGKCGSDAGSNQGGDDYGSGSTGSGGNDNNNNNNDEQNSSDCPGLLFCDEFDGTALDTNKWYANDNVGITVNNGWISLPNGSSITTPNNYLNSCADKSVKLYGIVDGGAITLGDGINLYLVDDVGELTCGNETAILRGIDGGLENYISFYKLPGTLSVSVNGTVASLPCNREVSLLQLTSGFDDLLEIDYVEVKCE
ncbi:hypothetical protein HYU08_02635 [Candidatus Woesearchaeota archaeon]|nr:hypothetical protein [Candidatus Woesearchaeota archaeon]